MARVRDHRLAVALHPSLGRGQLFGGPASVFRQRPEKVRRLGAIVAGYNQVANPDVFSPGRRKTTEVRGQVAVNGRAVSDTVELLLMNAEVVRLVPSREKKRDRRNGIQNSVPQPAPI